MEKIIIASNNAGKLREFRAILEPFGLEVVSQREAGFCQDVEETGTTFAENAAIKAKAVYAAMHCPVIADDSGLMVDALDGAPGVYSHRFAGEGATDADRNAKLLHKHRGGSFHRKGHVGHALFMGDGFAIFCKDAVRYMVPHAGGAQQGAIHIKNCVRGQFHGVPHNRFGVQNCTLQ